VNCAAWTRTAGNCASMAKPAAGPTSAGRPAVILAHRQALPATSLVRSGPRPTPTLKGSTQSADCSRPSAKPRGSRNQFSNPDRPDLLSRSSRAPGADRKRLPGALSSNGWSGELEGNLAYCDSGRTLSPNLHSLPVCPGADGWRGWRETFPHSSGRSVHLPPPRGAGACPLHPPPRHGLTANGRWSG